MLTTFAHVGGVEVAPLQLVPAAAAAFLYWRRCATLAGTPRAVPALRQWSYYGGIVLAVATLVSPLGHVAEHLFWAHMVEHLLLADAAALLLVAGLTGPVIAPILRLPVIGRLRVLAHPLVALPLWAANLLVWHLPLFHEAAVRHDTVHALQHLCFIGFGANVWMCLIGPLPMPAWFSTGAKAAYVLAVRATGAVLANALLFGGTFYAVYAPGERDFGISPSSDQVAAGAIMMVWESMLTICLFGWLFLRAAREGEERQELLDLAAARGVDLTEERARRAVQAGRGAELRERLFGTPALGAETAHDAVLHEEDPGPRQVAAGQEARRGRQEDGE